MNKRIAKKLSNRGGYKHYKTFYFILNSPFSSMKEYISIKKVWKQQMEELRNKASGKIKELQNEINGMEQCRELVMDWLSKEDK